MSRKRGFQACALGVVAGFAVATLLGVFSGSRVERPSPTAAGVRQRAPVDGPVQAKAGAEESQRRSKPRRVDPRRGGFELGLGEWALAPEADAIRPGEVTFVVHNRGTMVHGFEIELEGESSGPGSGDLFKAETRTLRPGESARMTLTLRPGVYKIECLVDGHDDMGMEGLLEVRRDAPLIEVERDVEPDQIAIRDFAFAPPRMEVSVGTEITWNNDDPAEHTVTASDGGFGSDSLGQGDSFSHRFERAGTFDYRCAIHPEMQGQVRVE